MADPLGLITAYTYDSGNRPVSISSPEGQVTFEYDELGRRARVNYPNRTYAQYTYDQAGRLTKLTTYGPTGNVICSYAYTHDKAGNRMSIMEADGTTHAYGYDAKYQLTDWMRKNGKGKQEYHFQYTYDPVGNRIGLKKQTFGKAKSSVATSGRRGNDPKSKDWWDHPSHSYAYDAANQLTEIGLGESAGKGKGNSWAVRFEYDANGNQVAKTDQYGTTAFEYDYNNMIKHIAFPDSNENTYHNSTEGLKRPVKIDSTGHVGNFYDDYQGVEHILWEYDEQGQPKTRYTLGPRPDEIISRTTSDGTTSYYHYDGLGSVVALTDENGNVLGRYEYAPFGKMLSQPEGIDNKFTFQGREYDQDSGLYYYRTRYLDPEIGRFISRDPIGDIANPVSRRVRTEAMTVLYQMAMLQLILADNETLSTADRMGLVAGAIADLKLIGVVASGDPIFAIYIGGLNQYVFCANNPVNFRDPLGLLTDNERNIIFRAIEMINNSGHTYLAKRLKSMLTQNLIDTSRWVPKRALGAVFPFMPNTILLNPERMPLDCKDVTMRNLVNTLAHEYIHTMQFDLPGGIIIFSGLNLIGSAAEGLAEQVLYEPNINPAEWIPRQFGNEAEDDVFRP